MIASAQVNSTSVPQIYMQHIFDGAPAAGTYTASSSIDLATQSANTGNPFLTYIENAEEMITLNYSDGSSLSTGGWWDKDLTVNITALDADNMKISLVANATMGYAYACLSGTDWNNVATRNLTLNVVNQAMTTGAKAFMKNHGIAKISR